jgi:hypothetical protein
MGGIRQGYATVSFLDAWPHPMQGNPMTQLLSLWIPGSAAANTSPIR